MTCVCLAMITAYVARSVRALYVLGAILFLIRIDGLLLFGLLAAALAVQQKRVPWRDVGVAVVIGAPWLLFSTVYFGSPIPTSLTAKLYVYSHAMATPRAVTIEAFRTQFIGGSTQKLLTVLFVVGVIGIVFKNLWESKEAPHLTSPTRGEEPLRSSLYSSLPREKPLVAGMAPGLRGALAAPVVWFGIYYITMFSSRVPPFPWYFLPPWPIYLIVAMLGGRLALGWIPGKLLVRFKPYKRQAALAALLAVGLYGAIHLAQIQAVIAEDQFVEDTLRTPMGLWFNKHARPNERILLEPIGYVGYFSQRPILDMIGLVSPEVFRSYRTRNVLADMVERFHPEWLCIRPAERESILRGNRSVLDNGYVYVREFHAPGRSPDFLIYHIRKAATVE